MSLKALQELQKNYHHRQEQKFVQIFLKRMISTKQKHFQKQHATLHLCIILISYEINITFVS